MKHGTVSSYSNGKCRCDECRRAHREYSRDYRKRRREKGGFSHGEYQSYLIHKCRCDKCKLSMAERRRLTRYGMTKEDFLDLLDRQNNRCALCQVEVSELTVVVDHDHLCCPGQKTCGNCTRGLLCPGCNQALGKFSDSISTILSAIRYLSS